MNSKTSIFMAQSLDLTLTKMVLHSLRNQTLVALEMIRQDFIQNFHPGMSNKTMTRPQMTLKLKTLKHPPQMTLSHFTLYSLF